MRAVAAALALALWPALCPAQDSLSMGQVRSPVLTIDVDRLVAETRFGQRLSEDLRAREEALAAENRRIEGELTAEEQDLTRRRPTIEIEEFRAEAEAFDQKVQRIRSEQDAKERDLAASIEEGRAEFLNAATPVLARLMIDSGAVVILERRDVFLSASVVDVTDQAVAAIDRQLGDGAVAPPEVGPEPTPEPAGPTAD